VRRQAARITKRQPSAAGFTSEPIGVTESPKLSIHWQKAGGTRLRFRNIRHCRFLGSSPNIHPYPASLVTHVSETLPTDHGSAE
jgi:hypothetical protein